MTVQSRSTISTPDVFCFFRLASSFLLSLHLLEIISCLFELVRALIEIQNTLHKLSHIYLKAARKPNGALIVQNFLLGAV